MDITWGVTLRLNNKVLFFFNVDLKKSKINGMKLQKSYLFAQIRNFLEELNNVENIGLII